MRGLAELAMRSPKHALAIAIAFACLPMFFWVSAGIISLVVLRHGKWNGLKILVWAILPGIAWAATGQFYPLIGLITTVTLACVLRVTVSWPKTLLTLLPVGGLVAVAITFITPNEQFIALSTQIINLIESQVTNVNNEGGELSDKISHVDPLLIKYGIICTLAWFSLIGCVLALILARFWQADLYSPGEFRKEFQAIRLPPIPAGWLVICSLALVMLKSYMVVVALLITAPLFWAGISLAHGLVEIRRMNKFWLMTFYLPLVFVPHVLYPIIILIAWLDSLFDFRTRIVNRL